MTSQDKPGTDWAAKHAAAGQNASQPQHESWTTADGPVQQRADATPDSQFLDQIEGTQ